MTANADKIRQALTCDTSGCACQSQKGKHVHCPAHNDTTPSLSVSVNRSGKILINCFAGCTQDAVIVALRELGLWPKPQRTDSQMTRYEIRNADDALIAVHIRLDRGNGKKMWWEKPDGSKCLGGIRTRDLPLYGSERLPSLPDGATVVITEGEKAAEALLGVGLNAVGTVGGAKITPSCDSLWPLTRLAVRLWPDKDLTGTRHMSNLGLELAKLGCRDIRLVDWADAPERGAAADAGALGLDLAEIVEQAKPWEPPPADGEESTKLPGSEIATYEATEEGIFWNKSTGDGIQRKGLSNFTAKIVGDIVQDDGAETSRRLEIEANLYGRGSVFTIPTNEFAAMSWVLDNLGARAVINPGFTIKDHLRVAIQTLSDDVNERKVFAHTGWRDLDGVWVYLHHGGGIGPDGPVGGVDVVLPDALASFEFPTPPTGEILREAVRASLKVIEVGQDETTLPPYCAVWRSVLGRVDHGHHMVGPTGEGKTTIAALLQQHFGAGLGDRNLPGNWSSTANALEGLAFTIKDALLVIDNFSPSGTAIEVQKLHALADRVYRAQGNSSGRQRMNQDLTIRPSRPPRGLMMGTGEDVPKGQSLRARLLVTEIGRGALDWAKISNCQVDANAGSYAAAMAAYVQWLASKYGEIRSGLADEMLELRAEAHKSDRHRRTASIVASLAVGFRHFMDFAVEIGAVTATEADNLRKRAWAAMGQAAAAQSDQQSAQDPAVRFMDLLKSGISSGRMHLAGPEGKEPDFPASWGWRVRIIGAGDNERSEWQPQGTGVGWVDDGAVYLEAESAYAEVQRLARDGGERVAVTLPTLKKRLHEQGYLASIETGADRGRLEVRRTLHPHFPYG